MAMINYADKVALNINSNIADINKVNATDMNELKNAFNNQVAQGWYKTGINPTFTFVSYDSETLTGVVSSDLDMTPYLNVGMKVKFTQNSAIKYAFITAITSNSITLFLGTDYSLNNSAISNSYYSMLKTPFGFPLDPDKWSISLTKNTDLYGTPTENTWWNPDSVSLTLPIGLWNILQNLIPRGAYTLPINGYYNVFWTLSTSNTTSTLPQFDTRFGGDIVTAGTYTNSVSSKSNQFYRATAKTTLYLLHKVHINGTMLSTNGFGSPTLLKATIAYL